MSVSPGVDTPFGLRVGMDSVGGSSRLSILLAWASLSVSVAVRVAISILVVEAGACSDARPGGNPLCFVSVDGGGFQGQRPESLFLRPLPLRPAFSSLHSPPAQWGAQARTWPLPRTPSWRALHAPLGPVLAPQQTPTKQVCKCVPYTSSRRPAALPSSSRCSQQGEPTAGAQASPRHTHTPGGGDLGSGPSCKPPCLPGLRSSPGGLPAPRHSFPSPFALWWQRTASPASALVVCILVQSVISAGFSISHYQLLKDSSDSARTAPGPRPASAPAGSGKTRFPSGSCSHAVRVSPHLRPGPPVWVPGFPEDSSSVALYRKVPSRPSFIM